MAIDYNQMAREYADAYRQRVAAQQQALYDQLGKSKQSTNATYDSNAAQAYINRMRQENALPEQLAARGINGGASESALVKIMNNYALGQSNNNAARATAIGQLQNTYDTNIANMNAEMERAIAENNNLMAQKQAEYEDLQNQRALEQFSATIERFTSVKSVDKAISKLDPNDSNYTAKKQLLQLRKSQLNGSKSSSGGGSKKSSGGSSKSSSKSSSSSSSKTSSSKSTAGKAISSGARTVASIAKNAAKKKNSGSPNR